MVNDVEGPHLAGNDDHEGPRSREVQYSDDEISQWKQLSSEATPLRHQSRSRVCRYWAPS